MFRHRNRDGNGEGIGRDVRAPWRKGFTLLEVILGVFILGIVVLSIYRFVELNLTAIRVTTEQLQEERSLRAVIDVVQAQLSGLPVAQSNALRGEAYKFQDIPQDELEWLTGPGNGLLTEHATSEYRVTLALRQNEQTGVVELGLRRIEEGGAPDVINWQPLMIGIRAMEIRHFDDRIKAWVERWVDAANRPTLIRLRLWRDFEELPYEAVLHLPARQFTMEGGAEE